MPKAVLYTRDEDRRWSRNCKWFCGFACVVLFCWLSTRVDWVSTGIALVACFLGDAHSSFDRWNKMLAGGGGKYPLCPHDCIYQGETERAK